MENKKTKVFSKLNLEESRIKEHINSALIRFRYIGLIMFLFVNACGKKELPDDDTLGVSDSNINSATVLESVANAPQCTQVDDGALFYVKDVKLFYYCADGEFKALNSSQSASGAVGATGATGATGPAGPGYTVRNLSVLTAATITNIASTNTGTNQFTSGTGAAALVDPVKAVDPSDAQLSDYTATTTFAYATTGLAANWGCVQFDLEPIMSGASLIKGYAYAKVGIISSTGSANAAVRWEYSANGVASNYLIGASLNLPMTTSERVFYISTEFLTRFLSICVQGNAARNHTLKIYQLYVAT